MDYDYNRAIEYSKSELDNVKNVIKELEQYRESINQAINRVNKYFIGYEEVYRNSLKWAEYFKKDYIVADFKHGIAPNSYLSRHAILHGGDTSYGTIENSLKCILLFDYIQDKFRLVSVGSGNAYHIISCPVVQRNRKSEWNLFNYHWEAEEQNKKPCELCKPNTLLY